ncbi:MAG: isochorismate synthase MenF [Acidimicrobiia bacterium]
MTLVARTRRLGADDAAGLDLLAEAGRRGFLFEQAGDGLAGRGEVARIPLPVGDGRLRVAADRVQEALRAVEVDHDEVGLPGTGPVAFAALPFADESPGSVVVPRVVAGRRGDTAWVTTIVDTDDPAGGGTGDPADGHDGDWRQATSEAGWPAPTSFTVRPGRTPASWCEAVEAAVARIRGGELDKVVLAREVVVETDHPVDVLAVLRQLRAGYPAAMLYLVDGFAGATPELLVERVGDVVRSHPHAGTTPRTGDPVADAARAAALFASEKDRAEHRVSIDMVLDTLLAFSSYVDSEPEPSIVTLANVQHLASMVEGRLSSPAADVLTLVAALHPNPMICGFPAAAARKVIADLEGFDRGRYTGAVGWVDARGDGRFGVAIRGAELDGNRARLFAGNGIVADSDAATELAETRAKLQAMLGAIVRP